MHERVGQPTENGEADGPPSVAAGRFYDVDQAALVAAYPSVATGADTFTALVEANENARVGGAVNRTTRRRYANVNAFGEAGRRFIFVGGHVIARNEDPTAGQQAGEEVLSQLPEAFSAPPDPTDDEDRGGSFRSLWDKRILPIAEPLRQVHTISSVVAAEIDATEKGDTAANYLLLKALATDPDPKRFEIKLLTSKDWLPSHALIALGGIARSDIRRRLTAQVLTGTFDRHIARDVVQFADGQRVVDPGFARIRQLGTFGLAFAGQSTEDKAAFYDRMAATLDEWPAAERQVIVESRQVILDALEANANRAATWLREFGFIADADPLTVFSESIDDLILEVVKRQKLSGPALVGIMQVMQQRGLHKRSRTSSRQRRDERKGGTETQAPSAEAAEEDRTPPTMITLNLNDHTSVDGVGGLIEEFVTKTSQGNDGKIRADLERMIQYMHRTDLPPGERRGVKIISNITITFLPDGQPRRLHEFKPSDAPGLPTGTNVGKNCRIYFIKLPNNVIGVVGIKPRADQDEFLRGLRAKAKRAPGGKQRVSGDSDEI
jgi:hypothetical protein